MPDLSQVVSFCLLIILQGKHVKDVHRGRREGEKVGDDWQITFLFLLSLLPIIPFPNVLQ